MSNKQSTKSKDKKPSVKSKTRTKSSKPVSAKSCNKTVYFDNNGTTIICPQAKNVYTQWLECYNPATDSKIAKPAREQIKKSVDLLLQHCGVSSLSHSVIFTSGATESNCFIIRACVKAYKKKLIESGSELLPHIIISSIEHPSIMECIKDLVDSDEIEASHIEPTIYGNILPEDVEQAIKVNTCLISIMYANNEIPIINNIKEIGAIAHEHNIPIHSDCVQVFGKYRINIANDNIDALSASAHKFYGPKGIGILILNNSLIDGYQLTGEINGNQQGGLRGGTENVSAICSMLTALKYAHSKRREKNARLYKLRRHLLDKLSKYIAFNKFENYIQEDMFATHQPIKREKIDKKPVLMKGVELVSLGPPDDKKEFILPNTVLLSVVKLHGAPFCNVQLKHFLDKKGFVISIGSACSTDSPNASHVLTAIGAPAIIKRGVLRISFGDFNTIGEVNAFVVCLLEGISLQCKDQEV